MTNPSRIWIYIRDEYFGELGGPLTDFKVVGKIYDEKVTNIIIKKNVIEIKKKVTNITLNWK